MSNLKDWISNHSNHLIIKEPSYPIVDILRENLWSEPFNLNFFIIFNLLLFESKVRIALHPSSNGEDPLSYFIGGYNI
jgi:hypothetical protein